MSSTKTATDDVVERAQALHDKWYDADRGSVTERESAHELSREYIPSLIREVAELRMSKPPVLSTVAELEALPFNAALLCEGSRSGEDDLDAVLIKRPAYDPVWDARYECGGTTLFGSDHMLDSWTTITAVYIP